MASDQAQIPQKEASPPMEELVGYVEAIVFTVPENGFTVAKLKEPRKKELTSIVGYLPSVQPGETIACKGIWKIHPSHGRQFEVVDYAVEIPSDVIGIQKYLESGLVKGIGPIYAKKIVDRFGADTLMIIDQVPHRLAEIVGLGQKKIDKLIECWRTQKSIRDVMIFLRAHGVSPAYAQRIYKAYGDLSIEKVKENPYKLAKDIFGIGFKIADAIAVKLGFALHSPERLSAGIEFVLWELSNEGHTCYPEAEFPELAKKALEVEITLIEAEIQRLVEKETLVRKDIPGVIQELGDAKKDAPILDQASAGAEADQPGRLVDASGFESGAVRRRQNQFLSHERYSLLWLKPFFAYEVGIAKDLVRLSQSPQAIRPIDATKAADWVEEKLRIQFAEQQKKAVIQALTNKVHIITGGPGTGKSTITNGILRVSERLTDKILLAAPTGRAAKRLTQITHRKAFTLHSLLEMDFASGGFKRGRDNPLECDLLIIDEASMIDTQLFFFLLRALPNATRLLIVGDIDQLPSVGPGTVLRDVIQSGLIGVTRLTEIFRQAKGSRIITNAHRINQGEFPFLSPAPESDFHFIEADQPEAIRQVILELVQKEVPTRWKLDPIEDIQVLSPMKKGMIGSEMMNDSLQQLLNPSDHPLFRGGRKFHLKDKVMQIRNNYDKKISNGDIGRIVAMDAKEGIMKICFDEREIDYDFSELDEIVLAYATSVHKYQGSECPCIIMPIHTSHFKLLHRNLLYTAVTRGKRQVYLIGTTKALAIAIHNDQVQKRYTGLEKAICESPRLKMSEQMDFIS